MLYFVSIVIVLNLWLLRYFCGVGGGGGDPVICSSFIWNPDMHGPSFTLTQIMSLISVLCDCCLCMALTLKQTGPVEAILSPMHAMNMTSQMNIIVGASLSKYCIADLMSWHTRGYWKTQNNRRTVSKTLCSHFPVNEATKATHTKHHTEVMSWFSRAYECRLCMDLPEANSTTMCGLYCLWAACPCLSWSCMHALTSVVFVTRASFTPTLCSGSSPSPTRQQAGAAGHIACTKLPEDVRSSWNI